VVLALRDQNIVLSGRAESKKKFQASVRNKQRLQRFGLKKSILAEEGRSRWKELFFVFPLGFV